MRWLLHDHTLEYSQHLYAALLTSTPTCDVLCHNQQRAVQSCDLLQDWHNVPHTLNLLVSDQHTAVVVLDQQALRHVHKLRADVATINLHTLGHLNKGLNAVTGKGGKGVKRAGKNKVSGLRSHCTDCGLSAMSSHQLELSALRKGRRDLASCRSGLLQHPVHAVYIHELPCYACWLVPLLPLLLLPPLLLLLPLLLRLLLNPQLLLLPVSYLLLLSMLSTPLLPTLSSASAIISPTLSSLPAEMEAMFCSRDSTGGSIRKTSHCGN